MAQADQPMTAGRRRARDKPWIFRTYAGHSTARELNRLYRQNLAKGQTGLSIAFDLPTQTGFDSDHILARGEVGKVGVAISHIGDMRALFEGIPLASMNTSMTINATAPWLMALYIATADEQGAPRDELQGTTQNDIIKEYLARGAYVFPPEASLRLTKDLILFCARETPKWNPMNVCSYHLQEAGATPVQELAYALATAIAVLERVRQSGEVEDAGFANVVGGMSFFVNAGMRFVTELAKMRAFVELWDEIARDRFGVADPAKRRFRYGVQVNSLGLTEQQPENNAYRILIEMLSVVLSKRARARAVQLPAWNEALGLPRPFDQQWSLRLQQIMAYETDLLEFGDLFDGSKEIAALVETLKAEAKAEIAAIDAMGGAVKAIETGALKSRLVESNTRRLEAIERGEQIVVGVNAFMNSEPSPLTAGETSIMVPSAEAEAEQIASLNAWRASRDPKRVKEALRMLRMAAASGREHHARLDRGGEGWRDHGRVGRCAARRIRRVPRADRRFAEGPAGGVGRSRRAPGRGRARVAQAREADQVPRRQTRPRRPFQRRRADRRPRARCRDGRHLRRHPLQPRRDRRAGQSGRPLRGFVDPLRVACRADRRGDCCASCGGPSAGSGDRRRDHPARRRGAAQGRRSRRSLYAQGFRDQRHPWRDREGGRGAARRGDARRAIADPVRAAAHSRGAAISAAVLSAFKGLRRLRNRRGYR